MALLGNANTQSSCLTPAGCCIIRSRRPHLVHPNCAPQPKRAVYIRVARATPIGTHAAAAALLPALHARRSHTSLLCAAKARTARKLPLVCQCDRAHRAHLRLALRMEIDMCNEEQARAWDTLEQILNEYIDPDDVDHDDPDGVTLDVILSKEERIELGPLGSELVAERTRTLLDLFPQDGGARENLRDALATWPSPFLAEEAPEVLGRMICLSGILEASLADLPKMCSDDIARLLKDPKAMQALAANKSAVEEAIRKHLYGVKQ